MCGGGGSEGLDQVPSCTGVAWLAVPLSTARLGGRALPPSKACSGQGAAGEMVVGMTVGPRGCPNNVRTRALKALTVS